MHIGLIGLGLAGRAMATRLVGAGHEVIGCDIAETAREAALGCGVTLAAGAAQAAGAGLLILSLPDSEVVTDVLWGDGGVGPALPQGSLVLDATTGRPADAVANHARLAERGVRFVDVTLSGSSEQIARGEATAMVGDAAEGADYDPLLRAFARSVHYLGEPGAGCLAKLVVNHVMGLNRAALAEGLAFGMAAGMDGPALLALLHDSAADSRVLEIKGRRMVEGDYAPASRLRQHAKDVRLILEAAAQAGVALPLEEVHARLLEMAQEIGLGDADNAALIEVYRASLQRSQP